jgi:hypothetical protein
MDVEANAGFADAIAGIKLLIYRYLEEAKLGKGGLVTSLAPAASAEHPFRELTDHSFDARCRDRNQCLCLSYSE